MRPTTAGNLADRIEDAMSRFPADPDWADDLEEVVRELRVETGPVAKAACSEPERPDVAERIAEVMANHPLPPEAVDEWENAIKEPRAWQDDREQTAPEARPT